LKLTGETIKSFHPDKYELAVPVDKIFNSSYQKELSDAIKEKYSLNILWIIDECDSLGFDKDAPDLKDWMKMHRHFGQRIHLICQSRFNIHKYYYNLVEYEILARRGFVINSFLYSYLQKTEVFGHDRVKKDKKIFDLYRSFNVKELGGKKSKIFKYMLGFGLFAVIILGYFIFYQSPKQFDKISEDNKVQKAMNEKMNDMSPSKTDPLTEPITYTFAGRIGGTYLVADQFGNIYSNDCISDAELWNVNVKKRILQQLNPKSGIVEYKPTYVKYVSNVNQVAPGRAGSGRATGPRSGGAEVRTRELWIDIR